MAEHFLVILLPLPAVLVSLASTTDGRRNEDLRTLLSSDQSLTDSSPPCARLQSRNPRINDSEQFKIVIHRLSGSSPSARPAADFLLSPGYGRGCGRGGVSVSTGADLVHRHVHFRGRDIRLQISL